MIAGVLAALMLSAPNAPPEKKIEVPDPVCPGGTEMKTSAKGTDFTRFCARPKGERQGPFVNVYTPTKTLDKRGSYHNGQLHGDWSRWYSNGTLREQGTYEEGRQSGYWTSFHENGEKASVGEYGQEGHKRGAWSTWNAEGKLLEEGEYKDNKKHGFWTTYDPKTGKILKQIEYTKGVERKP